MLLAFYSLFSLTGMPYIVLNKYFNVIICILLSCISCAFFNILIDNKLIKLMWKLLGCLLLLRLPIYTLLYEARAEMLPWHFFFSQITTCQVCPSVWLWSKSREDSLSPTFLLVDPVGISPEMVVALAFSPWILKPHQVQLQHDYHIPAPKRKAHISGQSSCCMRLRSWLLISKCI